MRTRTESSRRLPVLLVAALALGSLAWLGARPSAASVPANDPLAAAMGEINQAMKAIGKGVTAESRDSALAELAKIESALLTAKAQTPDTAAAVEEKKRAEFVAEFRTTLLEALKHACDAEIAVVNGKYKDADGALRKLGGLKSGAHDKFKGD